MITIVVWTLSVNFYFDMSIFFSQEIFINFFNFPNINEKSIGYDLAQFRRYVNEVERPLLFFIVQH